MSTTRFLVLNGIVWPLFTALTVLAIKRSELRWFLTTFGTIVLVNAALHILGTLASSSYSPGLITGVFLYVPIGGLAVANGKRQLSQGSFGVAVLAGLLVHALVAVIAFA